MSTFVITLVCLRYLLSNAVNVSYKPIKINIQKKKKKKKEREREKILCLFGSDVLITTDTQNSVQLK